MGSNVTFRPLGLLPAFLLGLGLLTLPARATIRVVDPANGPYYAIQQALDASAPGDTVEVVPGTYIVWLFPRVGVLLRSRDGPAVTILDGRGGNPLLDFERIELAVTGFTFQNGRRIEGGGAIRYSDGTLLATNCVFRDNHAYHLGWNDRADGGAILAEGQVHGVFIDCLFVGNEAEGVESAWGGAVAVRYAGADPIMPFQFLGCSFLSNRAARISAISINRPVEVRRCLFVDKRDSYGPFVYHPVGSRIECNLYQSGTSPQVEGTWSKTGEESEEVDPRVCPDQPEALHESSPAYTNAGCGLIGCLPIGCRDPVVLAVRPFALEPGPEQVVRVYGYGLEEVLEARLVGPGGATAVSRGEAVEGVWFTAVFDLVGLPPGAWSLVLRTATAGDVVVDGLVLSPVRVWGFFDGWVDAPGLYEGRLSGRNLPEGVEASLRQGEQGPRIPVEVVERIGSDTLRVRIDLAHAAEGAWDLEVRTPAAETLAVRPALYLGAPTVVRVPEDAPTIAEALAMAPLCAEVQVARATYHESLVIEKPVRLRGIDPEYRVLLRPGASGERPIHILPEAGPLTEIERLSIGQARVEGPGGGILCEAPALIRDCSFYDNDVAGPGARGGGIFAPAGARIVGNFFYDNNAASSIGPTNPWSLDPAEGGAGGGLFCLRCWVEDNDFEYGNTAGVGGMAVADGVFRDNRILGFSGYEEARWPLGALRGEISANRFDNCCGTTVPYMLFEGPSRLTRNIFTDEAWDLCMWYDSIHLRGSMDLTENAFLNVGIEACLVTDDVLEPHGGHFRMVRNSLLSIPIKLYLDGDEGPCVKEGPDEPRSPIDPDSLLFSCNIKGWGTEVVFVENGIEEPCFECAYRVEDLPFGCPDTIPYVEHRCGNTPVLLQSWGIEPTNAGVRLFWGTPLDTQVEGFDIEREHAGARERLTSERLPPCHDCEFLDSSPLVGEISAYWLLIYSGGAEPVAVRLGEWDGRLPAVREPGLAMPAPHPVRDRATLRFDLPVAGGQARLEALDLQGRRVALIHEGFRPGGRNVLAWEARDERGRPLASGFYVLKLSIEGRSWTRKVLLLH